MVLTNPILKLYTLLQAVPTTLGLPGFQKSSSSPTLKGRIYCGAKGAAAHPPPILGFAPQLPSHTQPVPR